MIDIQWRGVFPAVTTKLSADLSIDAQALATGLERLIENGVSGVVMMGMVGENAQLSPEEKRHVLEVAVRTVSGRVPVLSGVAEASTERAAEFARQAQELGVDGLMVFPGLTYRSDRRETVQFYTTVARASALPIMLYNNPGAYGVDLTPDLVEDLVHESTIVAIKEESYVTARVTDLISRFGDRFAVVCGVDDMVLESVALGASAWVSGMANALPNQSVALFDAAARGDLAVARQLYRALTPLYHLDTVPKLVQHIKLAEHILTGSPETVKPPRLSLVGEERERSAGILYKCLEDLKSLGF